MKAGKRVFVQAQSDLLREVLDRIVPANGDLPGAGKLGVAGHVESAVAASPEMVRLFTQGLTEVEIASHQHHSADFAGLSGEKKDELLRAIESAQPEFFAELVRQTYMGYYSDPRVVALLGMEARPPQPLGYELEPGDLGPLENVRKRGRIYREV